jgi:hypothetical protein
MNWLILTYQNLTRKASTKFLLIFSFCTLAIAGIVWACADGGEENYSMFSPEAFVAKDYTPFFYDSNYWYYGQSVEVDDNNNRFNDQVVDEWDTYFNHQLNKPTLRYLLLKVSQKGIDSVNNYVNGKIAKLKPDSVQINTSKLDKAKFNNLFGYLKLAKECEKFAVIAPYGWYDTPPPLPPVSAKLEGSLSSAFNHSKDPFIKQRLWFQLVRFYFFNDDTTKSKTGAIDNKADILVWFNNYKGMFPQNLTYYRAMGYVAGYYRRKGNYALSNYLYSRCYDYSYELKIPSKFSFHAQQEADWQATLKLAKNNNEKITLWHMLGMEYDPVRAIKEIAALNPKSDKMDLLLSRIINTSEGGYQSNYYGKIADTTQQAIKKAETRQVNLIDSIASKNNTTKPYYWNLAAGYLNYIYKDYKKAGKFYDAAKKQLPANDKLVTAQYKLLTILLSIDELQRIDPKTEAKITEPLTWLVNLRDGKERITNLRFDPALGICANHIAQIYQKQSDWLKAHCFKDSIDLYDDSTHVQKLVDLMTKPQKSAFEITMLRYYPHKLDELYYHQATLLTYKEEVDKAIEKMSLIKTMSPDTLYGNPFNSRLNDCHDCDHAAHQKQKFSPLTFLKTMQSIKTDLRAGKDKYRNAWLLANAYYNITYYGNGRLFYQSPIMAEVTDQSIAEKYYLLAKANAQTNEQRARCTFMAAKCERNEYYNHYTADNKNSSLDEAPVPTAGKYFADLKDHYSNTKYYQEVLQECGYFKSYVTGK